MRKILSAIGLCFLAAPYAVLLSQTLIGPPTLDTRLYDFPVQTPGGSLTAGGVNQGITMKPCPRGVNGTNKFHPVYLSAGSGTPEATRITGGSCMSGAASGTITVTPMYAHSGAWTVRSASDGVMEAIWAAPASGAEVVMPAGTVTWEVDQITIGDGVGTTQSTRKGIRLRGQGASSDNVAFPSGTLVTYAGAGTTGIKVQGPIQGVWLSDFTFDGGALLTKPVDILACTQCGMERVTLRHFAAAAKGITANAVADPNGNTYGGTFRDLTINADSSGSTCLDLGPTNVNYNGGTFHNLFSSIQCKFKNDTNASHAVILGWADNNLFINFKGQALTATTYALGGGSAVHHTRMPAGAAGFDFLPSENIFINPGLGCATCTAVTGDSGSGIGTVFWPWQTLDSGPIPTGIKNVRGWSTGGLFFDSNTVSRMAFRDLLNIYSSSGVAELDVAGFKAGATGTGTITTSGATVSGVGTAFNTQLSLGKFIYAAGEFRRITAIASATSMTIASAFADDITTGVTFLYSLGSSGYWYSDGSTHIGTYDNTPLKLGANNIDWGQLDPSGAFTNRGPMVGSGGDLGYSNAGGNIITAAQLIWGALRRTAGGAQADTTPTAAQIVAALGTNAQVGHIFEFRVYNNSGGTHTLTLGSGVTIAPGFTSVLTTTAGNRHSFVFRVTNVTGGAEAVQVYSDGQGAF